MFLEGVLKKLLLVVVLCLAVSIACAYAKGGSGGGRGVGGRSGGVSGDRGSGSGGVGQPSSPGDTRSNSAYTGSSSGAPRGSYVQGSYYGGNYYPGGYYGGYNRYYYRGRAPRGATFGFYFKGAAVGIVPAWWPYYAVSVPPAYYDPYYQYPYPAPPYVIEVPPPEATTAYPQGPQIIEIPPPEAAATYPIGPPSATTPPIQCYAPKTDPKGNVIKENDNMVPDFSKPVPCPLQQSG